MYNNTLCSMRFKLRSNFGIFRIILGNLNINLKKLGGMEN